jgi:hypothetical protein
MLTALLAVATTSLCTAAPRDTVRADTVLASAWDAGVPFAQFAPTIAARKDEWRRGIDSARVDAATVARGRKAGGTWRLLVVATDNCGDSMRAVPVLAALDDSLPNLELRIVAPARARAVQETYRAWNGRVVTPTIVLLDSAGRAAGCIVERPAPVRAMQRASYGALMAGRASTDSLTRVMLRWWETDRGASIAAEAVELLESAKAGLPLCERGLAPSR